MTQAGVLVSGLGVRFQLDRARRPVTPALARLLPRGQETWALRDLDLRVSPGEAVGLVGPSGTGKTTLLRVLAGVLPADEGEVAVHGRIGSLLSIQAGLLARLTGSENAVLLAVLSGLSRREARAALPRIRERSGLGQAFDDPVMSYSQGMRARLGFAAADAADPQVLLLDEVHEALDHDFRAYVEQRVTEIRNSGGLVIAAGHDHGLLARLTTRTVRLSGGSAAEDGSARNVTPLKRRARGVG